MFFELSQLPQAMQEHILNNDNSMVQIVNNGQVIKNVHFDEPNDEQAYYEYFYRHHFDIERLKKAIGETDENGRAKKTIALPQGLTKEQLKVWLDENIPKHLAKKTTAEGVLA